MPDPHDIFSGDQGRLDEILSKISAYQHSLPDGRAVELEELQRQGVLSSTDIDFMSAHSIAYKPHRVSDYHALDMLQMPTPDGGCVFVGPAGLPLKKRRTHLGEFQAVVQKFLRIPRPEDELLLHIELGKHDGMGVSPKTIVSIFGSETWRERLPAIRTVAAEFGLHPHQDEIVQLHHLLGFDVPRDADQTATIVVALLSRGCGLTSECEVVYSAGALGGSDFCCTEYAGRVSRLIGSAWRRIAERFR
jgi:hypothetical protein